MSTASGQPATVTSKSLNSATDFRIVEDTLIIPDLVTSNLDAYRWNAPNSVPVFFIFTNCDVHIITLDEGENAFSRVRTRNEEKDITTVTEEDILKFSDEGERYMLRQAAHA